MGEWARGHVREWACRHVPSTRGQSGNGLGGWGSAPALFLIAGLAAAVGCTRVAGEAPSRATIRLTTGVPGGFFHPLGAAMVDGYARLLPQYAFQVVPSGGAINNLAVLQRGDADIGLAFADVAFMAFVGRLDETPVAFDQLRAVAALQLTTVHVIVRPGSGITSISQLAGRSVALGPVGSGTAATARVLLQSFGVSMSEVHSEYLPFVDAARLVARGQLDAAFVSAGYPADSVLSATRAGADLLEVTGPLVERLRVDHPFLRAALIPAGTYPTRRGAVHTVGIDTLIACRAGLDERLVYELTRSFFELLPDLASHVDALRRMDLARAPATPIPLHEGAARYYRERELFR